MPKSVNRMDRVNELIKRELAELIEREWTVPCLLTVTKVETSPDLHTAVVYVSIFGGDEHAESEAMKFLRRHRGELQHKMTKAVILKYTPHLSFSIDHNIAAGSKVLAIMENLDIGPEHDENRS